MSQCEHVASSDEVYNLLALFECLILDVRSKQEYVLGHVRRAHHVPETSEPCEQFLDSIHEEFGSVDDLTRVILTISEQQQHQTTSKAGGFRPSFCIEQSETFSLCVWIVFATLFTPMFGWGTSGRWLGVFGSLAESDRGRSVSWIACDRRASSLGRSSNELGHQAGQCRRDHHGEQGTRLSTRLPTRQGRGQGEGEQGEEQEGDKTECDDRLTPSQ